MPFKAENFAKDAKPTRQTTLFEASKLQHSTPSPRKRSSISSRKKMTYISDSSSDEISAVKMAPSTKAKSSSEDDDMPIIPSSSIKKRTRRVYVSSSDEEKGGKVQSTCSEGDDERPAQRRRLHRQSSAGHESEAGEEEEEENLAELANEVEEERILNSRFRSRKPTTFQANLERLRRRKLKLPEESDKCSEDDDEQENSDEEPTTLMHFKTAKPSDDAEESEDEGTTSDNSSDFIVDDEGEGTVQLPPEYSMDTHQDISHQFKKIFQFFVHIAVQPLKKRAHFMEAEMKGQQYFSVPLQVTRRKLSGLRDSLVASSVWKPEFKDSLERYPEFETVDLDFAVPGCDACHLGGRLSKLLGRLSGDSYNRTGFRKNSPRKSGKHRKPDVVEYHLGRFCARRTRVYHGFLHWEYNLFNVILGEIERLHGGGDFHAVAWSGGAEPPANLNDADAICNWLDERRVIDMEWRRLKGLMESARHLDMAAKEGGEDD